MIEGMDVVEGNEIFGTFSRELEPGAGPGLADAIRARVIHCWHPVGTCAMGIACDERGRVHGVDGLVVADASLFPQTVRATTNIPTVVLGERIGGWLAGGRG